MKKVIHTLRTPRKKAGEVETYILREMMKTPECSWQTKDFLKLLRAEFKIIERKGIINHFNKLIKNGFVEKHVGSNRNDTFYKLHRDWKKQDFFLRLSEKYMMWLWRLMQFYPADFIIGINEKQKSFVKRKKINIHKKRLLNSIGNNIIPLVLTKQYRKENKQQLKIWINLLKGNKKIYCYENGKSYIIDLRRISRKFKKTLSLFLTQILINLKNDSFQIVSAK